MNGKIHCQSFRVLSTCVISINIRCKSGHNAGPHQKKLKDLYFAKISLIKETAGTFSTVRSLFLVLTLPNHDGRGIEEGTELKLAVELNFTVHLM